MENTAIFSTTTFEEHPYQASVSSNPHDISILAKFDQQTYNQQLFHRILSIGLSDLPDFLTYQCKQVSRPIVWLNNLEKLIMLNMDFFNTPKLHHRHTKLISQIDLKRTQLEKAQRKKKSSLVIGYNSVKEYSFSEVKEQAQTYTTTAEKILFLNDQIFDYQQNPPEYINTKSLPFDKLCQIEIERLERKEVLAARIESQKQQTPANVKKIPFNGELKVLCDIYYQMMRKKTRDKEPILTQSIAQITDHICNAFCYADGSSISASTVRTYLSPSKPENRPKTDSEFDID